MARQRVGRHGPQPSRSPYRGPGWSRTPTLGVDDRLDVLAYLDTVEHRFWFVGGTEDQDTARTAPDWATVIETWAELAVAVLPSA